MIADLPNLNQDIADASAQWQSLHEDLNRRAGESGVLSVSQVLSLEDVDTLGFLINRHYDFVDSANHRLDLTKFELALIKARHMPISEMEFV